MSPTEPPKRRDLIERTTSFAHAVRVFINKIPRTINTIEDCKQVVRASGSIGANFIEANEALSEKDGTTRLKICRKEARETLYWLQLLLPDVPENHVYEARALLQEAHELTLILQTIIRKRSTAT